MSDQDRLTLRDCVTILPLATDETRWRTSIQGLFEHAVSGLNGRRGQQRAHECLDSSRLSTAVNLLTLCLYQQGLARRAQVLTEQHAEAISQISCVCGRILSVQPQINLIRLGRSLADHPLLTTAWQDLDSAVQSVLSTDTSGVPFAVSVDGRPVRDDIQTVVEHIRWVETAKLLWRLQRYDQCMSFCEDGPIAIGTLQELYLRSLCKLGMYERVVGWVHDYARRHPWSLPYAAVAFLEAGLKQEAYAVAHRVVTLGPLFKLRWASELVVAGDDSGGAELARQVIDHSQRSGDEVLLILSEALLYATGVVQSGPFLASHALRNTAHNVTRAAALGAVIDTAGASAGELSLRIRSLIDRALLDNLDVQDRLDRFRVSNAPSARRLSSSVWDGIREDINGFASEVEEECVRLIRLLR